MLKDRGNDNFFLNLDSNIRRHLNRNGKTFVCGDAPAPGNLALEQYVEAWNRMEKEMPPNVKDFLKQNNSAAAALSETILKNCVR